MTFLDISIWCKRWLNCSFEVLYFEISFIVTIYTVEMCLNNAISRFLIQIFVVKIISVYELI